MNWEMVATMVFFLGIVVGLIRWIGNTLRDIVGSDDRPSRLGSFTKVSTTTRTVSLSEATPDIPIDLSALSERERDFYLAQVAARKAAPPPAPDVAEPAPIRAGSAAPLAARGAVLVHCPACGNPLTKVAYPVPFVVDCAKCDHRVHVRGDGPGRYSAVVSEPRIET